MGHVPETPIDKVLHVLPVEPSETCPQRGDRDGCDPVMPQCPSEVLKAGVDVRDAAGFTPMTLCRKVDDEPRTGVTRLENKYTARLHQTFAACFRIGGVVFRERTPELQCEPLPHRSDAVDGVDEGIRVGGQEIAMCDRDAGHGPGAGAQSPAPGSDRPQAASGKSRCLPLQRSSNGCRVMPLSTGSGSGSVEG